MIKRTLLAFLISTAALAGPTIVESGGYTFLPGLRLTSKGLVAPTSTTINDVSTVALNSGVVIGAVSGLPGLWIQLGGTLTPNTANYALIDAGSGLIINSRSSTSMTFRIDNNTSMSMSATALLLAATTDLQMAQSKKLTFDGATAAKYLSSDGTTLTLTGLNYTAPKLTSTTASGGDSVVITKGARLQLNSADDPNNNTISSSANGVITFGTGATEIDASVGQMNIRNVGLTAWTADSFANDGAAAIAYTIRTQNTFVPATNPNARILTIQNHGTTVIGWDGNGKENYPTGGAAAVVGRSALTTGTVTVSTTAVTASSVIQLTRCVAGGTVGVLQVGTVTAGTSFVINSVQPGTASTIQAADTATVCWSFVN